MALWQRDSGWRRHSPKNQNKKMEAEKREITFKVLVVGEPAVGKTCILQRYVHSRFTSNYKVTVYPSSLPSFLSQSPFPHLSDWGGLPAKDDTV